MRAFARSVIVAFAFTSGIAACNQDGSTGMQPAGGDATSEVLTLDNLAAAGGVRPNNACRIAEDAEAAGGKLNDKYADKVLLGDVIDVDGNKDNLREAVKIALTAVPDYSQKLFKKLGGRIHVVGEGTEAAKLCGALFRDASNANFTTDVVRETMESCILLTDVKGARSLQLVLRGTEASIGHNLVKTFGYFHTQFVPSLVENVGASGPLFTLSAEQTDAMAGLVEQLSDSFIDDLLASKVFDPNGLSYLFGGAKNAGDTIASALTKGKGLKDRFELLTLRYPGETAAVEPSVRTLRAKRIRATLVANTYDSLYCRPAGAWDAAAAKGAKAPKDLAALTNTVKVFETFFPATHKTFTDSDKGVLKAFRAQADDLTARVDAKQNGQQPSASLTYERDGFGLQGDGGLLAILGALFSGAKSGVASAPTTGAANAGALTGLFANAGSSGGSVCGCPPGCNCSTCGCCGGSGAKAPTGASGGTCGASCGCSGGCCSGNADVMV